MHSTLKTKTLSLLAFAAVAAGFSGAVQAEQSSSEWRLLGPAFAHHFGTEGAVIKRHAGTETKCTEQEQATGGKPFVSDKPIAGPFTAIGRTADGGYIYMSSAAYVPPECEEVVVTEQRAGWENVNPALGLEYTVRYETHNDKVLATLVRDSYGKPSFMLAAGRTWPIANVFGVQVDAGAVGGLWNRTVLDRDGDDVVRRTVPFVLPALSLSESRSGLGLNLAFAPKVSINGYSVTRTPTLMLQTTWLVRKTNNDSSGVNVEVKPSGDVQATYTHSF